MNKADITNKLFIELHVSDLDKVREFYGKLGFKMVSEDPIGEQLGYLVLQRGETLLNFYGGDERVYKHAFFRDFPEGTTRGYGVEITIPVDDVEDYYQQVLSHIEGCTVQPLTLKRWGKKDFRIADPFGFYVRFTEPIDWYKTTESLLDE